MRRAQSTIYYAMFHCLARNAADMLVGTDEATTSRKAWLQVYRALNHNTVFVRCDHALISRFPATVQEFGDHFKMQQIKRHEADYAPTLQMELEAVRNDLEIVRAVIADFEAQPEKDRRAFAAYLIIEQRNEKTIKRTTPASGGESQKP